jgi:integrase
MAEHLDRVDARAKLQPRRDPYWHKLAQGRFVGFRRMARGTEGTWLARCYLGDKYEHRSLGDFATLADKARFDAAVAAAEEWFGHLGAGGDAKPGTVKEACEAYAEHLRAEKSEAAAKDAEGFYKRIVYGDGDKHPADPIARVDLAKATRRHFEEYRKRLLKAAGSIPSFNRSISPVRAALNHAKEVGKVPSDQAWAVPLKPLKDEGKGAGGLRAGTRRELYLEPAERAKLIEHASDETKRFLTVLRLLPLRPGDVANLKVAHFNAHDKTLSIPAGKTKRRDIPLSADAVAHLKACAKDKLPGVWLISRDGDNRQWKKEAWRDEIKLAAAGAKLPRAIVAYTFRHSVITDLVKSSDIDLLTVAQLSGTSVAMIEKHYGKLRQKHARAALEALAKM